MPAETLRAPFGGHEAAILPRVSHGSTAPVRAWVHFTAQLRTQNLLSRWGRHRRATRRHDDTWMESRRNRGPDSTSRAPDDSWGRRRMS